MIMMVMQKRIGVVVLEPDRGLLGTLCSLAAHVWGADDVLPRTTPLELHNAAENLSIGLVVVRASYHRSNPLIQSALADLYAMGTQIVLIEDTRFRVAAKQWLSLAGLYFLSNQASENELKALLRFALVRHCIPNANVLG
jgi:hypothetical protein